MEISSPFSNSDGFEESDFFSDDEISASPIRNYFKGKTIFLTGATGYIGQLLMEKLLRCDVKQLYILARKKKDISPMERFRKMFEEVHFTKLRNYNKNFMKKLVIIEGDLSKQFLGIKSSDLQLLESSVEIILHSAADVRFNETLLNLIQTNLCGTKELLQLAEKCKGLQVFSYVSTAYSNCAHNKKVEEKINEPPIDIDSIMAFAERCRRQPQDLLCLEYLTTKLIGTWPNTYTFSKSLSETLVRQYCGKFPICVVRPSIVISVYRDPEPGWTNSVFGMNGLFTAIGVGLLRVCQSRPNVVIDIVSADFVINGILAVTWSTHEDSQKPKMMPDTGLVSSKTPSSPSPSPEVYAIVSSSPHLTVRHLGDSMLSLFEQYPAKNIVWPTCYVGTACPFIIYYFSIFYHFLSMLIYDWALTLKGHKIRILPIVRKIHVFQKAISYFTSNYWKFENLNMLKVCDRMHPIDKRLFLCDTRLYDYDKWIFTYMQGLKKYLAKDPLDDQNGARIRYKRLRITHFFVLIVHYIVQVFIIYWLAKGLGLIRYANDFV